MNNAMTTVSLIWTVQTREGGLHAAYTSASKAKARMAKGLRFDDSVGWFIRSITPMDVTPRAWAHLLSRLPVTA